MATSLELSASLRSETGRHVHAVRRRGEVPAVLYGHNVEPQALSIDARSLRRVWHGAGHSHLVDLALDGGRARKVLIRELQVNPRTTQLMHVDLFAVNLREKLTVEIPLIPVGESPAVTELKLGVLQQIITAVKVECMPGDIPAQLDVDISRLVEIDQGIRLSRGAPPRAGGARNRCRSRRARPQGRPGARRRRTRGGGGGCAR